MRHSLLSDLPVYKFIVLVGQVALCRPDQQVGNPLFYDLTVLANLESVSRWIWGMHEQINGRNTPMTFNSTQKLLEHFDKILEN